MQLHSHLNNGFTLVAHHLTFTTAHHNSCVVHRAHRLMPSLLLCLLWLAIGLGLLWLTIDVAGAAAEKQFPRPQSVGSMSGSETASVLGCSEEQAALLIAALETRLAGARCSPLCSLSSVSFRLLVRPCCSLRCVCVCCSVLVVATACASRCVSLTTRATPVA